MIVERMGARIMAKSGTSRSSLGSAPRWSSLVAATAVAVLLPFANLSPAQAGFSGIDQDCQDAAVRVTAPKFDAAYFNQLTEIWASSDGQTGVFFLRGASGTYVLKFEDGINVGALVARRMLKSLNVPSDTMVADFTDVGKIETIFNGIVNAAARVGIPDARRKSRFDELKDRLQAKFSNAPINPPRQLMVTQFLTSYEGAPSLGAALLPGADIGSLDATQKTRRAKQFFGAVKALGNPHNQRFLGYLYVVDILLGNNDRFLRTLSNWNNVFLAQGTNDAACLVAIDNEAHAPLASYIAMARYAYVKREEVPARYDSKAKKPLPLKRFGQVVRFQTVADPDASGSDQPVTASGLGLKFLQDKMKEYERLKTPVNNIQFLKPALGATVKGEKQSITGQEYLEALMGQYEDWNGGANPIFFGPKAAFEGNFLDDRWQGPALDTSGPTIAGCQRISDSQGPGTIKPWIRRHLRMELSSLISGLMQGPMATLTQGTMNVTYTTLDVDGRRLAPQNFASHKNVCKTELDVQAAVLPGGSLNVSVDWAEFDQNFQEGVDMAMRDVRDMNGLTTMLTAAFKSMPNHKTTDVHLSAMTARAQFMAKLAAGSDINTIIQDMLVQQSKQFYTKGADFPAATFDFKTVHDMDIWLPK
jgi:hypothetical protein